MQSNNVKDMRNLDHLATMAGQIVSQCLNKHEDAMVAFLNPIECGAPRLQASTPREALFQLLLAAGDLGQLVGTCDWDQEALTRRHARIEACVHSAINVFERECKLDRDELGGAYFSYRDYKPPLWQADNAAYL